MRVTEQSRARAQRVTGRLSSARSAVLIEGEYVNAVGIAKRLDIEQTMAAKRLRREQGKPGAVTWEGLAK